MKNLEFASVLIKILRPDNGKMCPSKFKCELPTCHKLFVFVLSRPTNSHLLRICWYGKLNVQDARCIHQNSYEVCYDRTTWQSPLTGDIPNCDLCYVGRESRYMPVLKPTWCTYIYIVTCTVLQTGRSRDRFPMVSEFFIDIILPVAQWPWE
jgi:hypothetical protein